MQISDVVGLGRKLNQLVARQDVVLALGEHQ